MLTVTPEELCQAFTANVKDAEAKYKDELVEMSGTVMDFGLDGAGEPYISLEAAGSTLGVMCLTVEREPWGKAVPGQRVTLRGTVAEMSGLIRIVRVLRCEFTMLEASPAISISAADLAEEYVADREATIAKFDNKILRITGDVLDTDAEDGSVYLQGTDEVPVRCNLSLNEHLVKSILEGQTFTAVGKFSLNLSPEFVNVLFCLPITGR